MFRVEHTKSKSETLKRQETTMTQTWTYGSKTVIVEAGLVVSSDSAAFTVGEKADPRRLKACGWKKVKAAVKFDGFGRRFGTDGSIERK